MGDRLACPLNAENAENPQAIARGFLYSHKGRYEPSRPHAMVGMNEHTQDTRYDAIAATQFTSQQDEIIST